MMQHGVLLYPEYCVICSATWWMLQQFALQQVPDIEDVIFSVLSDENTPKTRIFCKIRTFTIFDLFLNYFILFGILGYSSENKINN